MRYYGRAQGAAGGNGPQVSVCRFVYRRIGWRASSSCRGVGCVMDIFMKVCKLVLEGELFGGCFKSDVCVGVGLALGVLHDC